MTERTTGGLLRLPDELDLWESLPVTLSGLARVADAAKNGGDGVGELERLVGHAVLDFLAPYEFGDEDEEAEDAEPGFYYTTRGAAYVPPEDRAAVAGRVRELMAAVRDDDVLRRNPDLLEVAMGEFLHGEGASPD